MSGPGAAPPPLPLEEWEPTKDTLHLWCQIVGKIRLACTPHRNHWWNAPLYVDVRGLTTRRMHRAGVTFAIDLDLVDHELVVRTHRGEVRRLPLRDGLSVAAFDRGLHGLLGDLGVDVPIRETPFGVPMTTPFPEDAAHASYDAGAVHRWWRALDWIDTVFEEFAGRSTLKTSPVHLFWHSFDLAVTRFSGRAAPPSDAAADAVTREAYSHEVVSLGFWAGDPRVRMPAFYAYAAPEPPGLRDRPLRPAAAEWQALPTGSMALLPYDAVRTAADPRGTLLDFMQSAFEAGAGAGGWDLAAAAPATGP